MFGQSPLTTSSAFGSTAPASPFSFGTAQTATTPSSAQKFGVFGTPSNTTTTTTAPSFFGTPSTASSNANRSFFGTPTTTTPTSGFGLSQPQTFQQQQQQQQQILSQPFQILKLIEDAYNPASETCRFQHMFYNVSTVETSRYTKPPLANDRLWASAVTENPDPEHLVPVLVQGAKELNQRVSSQNDMIKKHEATLSATQENTQKIERQHDLTTSQKIEQFKKREIELSRRLIRVLGALETIKSRGSYITSDEAKWKSKVEALFKDVSHPSPLRQQLLELVSATGSRYDSYTNSIQQPSEETLKGIFTYLEQKQKGISSVKDLVIQDGKDVKKMLDSLNSDLGARNKLDR